MLSVVIKAVEPIIADEEAQDELRIEGHTISKCICIKTSQVTPCYMERTLTTHQQTIHELLNQEAFIY